MQKIVVNKCYGGFCMSEQAMLVHNKLCNTCPCVRNEIPYESPERNCPILIDVVERLGEAASSSGSSKLQITEIPDDVQWEIGEYDGMEWVAERHRRW